MCLTTRPMAARSGTTPATSSCNLSASKTKSRRTRKGRTAIASSTVPSSSRRNGFTIVTTSIRNKRVTNREIRVCPTTTEASCMAIRGRGKASNGGRTINTSTIGRATPTSITSSRGGKSHPQVTAMFLKIHTDHVVAATSTFTLEASEAIQTKTTNKSRSPTIGDLPTTGTSHRTSSNPCLRKHRATTRKSQNST